MVVLKPFDHGLGLLFLPIYVGMNAAKELLAAVLGGMALVPCPRWFWACPLGYR